MRIVPSSPVVNTRADRTDYNDVDPSDAPRTPWLRWSLAVAVAGLLAVLQPWKSFGHPVSTPTQPVEQPRLVTISEPTRAAAANVVLPATIRPWQSTTLNARVSGYLAAWHADLGAQVKAGDILAEIETPELDQELAQAKALALEAKAAALQARAERVEAEADLKVAEAQLESARADVRLATSQHARNEKLLSKGVVTQEMFDVTRQQVETKTAQVSGAESDLARRRANLETRTAIIEAREATASSREANVERLKETLAFKRIVAPFDGTVTRRTAEVGMLVTVGQEPLFTLEDTSRVRVQVEVPQAYALHTRSGAAVTVSLPESSARDTGATITRVAESVQSVSRTMLAEVELSNAAHQWTPGSFARVAIATPADTSSWTIPTNTVSMRVEGPHIAVLDSLNAIEMRAVKLGRDLGSRVVVSEGIRGGERLVVNPGDELSNGMKVDVQDAGDRLAQK
jgi:multidrug efflux pump subunit AcrA (membrane-fusion protein)